MVHPITAKAAKRLRVCREQSHPHNRFTIKQSCDNHSVKYNGFCKGKWLQRYEQGGTPAVTKKAAGTNTHNLKLTPSTKAFLVDKFKTEKKNSGKALRRVLTAEFTARGTPERSVPCGKSITNLIREETGARVRPPPKNIMVKTPWAARYRKYFAEEHIEDEEKEIIFTDEKIFTIYYMGGTAAGESTFRLPDQEHNVAKGMTDEEYQKWREDHLGGDRILTTKKGKGKYKIRGWGGVGYNCKTELYLHNQHMNGDVYFEEVIKKRLVSMRKNPPGRETSRGGRSRGNVRNAVDINVIQDNCSIHNVEEIRTFCEENGINLIVSQQLDANEEYVDDFQHLKEGNQRYDAFPPYSPDLNAVIEKCWRELAYRIYQRYIKGEINSVEEHIEVIQEEWANLEFEATDAATDAKWGRHWIGINGWVRKWKQICQEVIDENGFDTHYM